MSFQAYLIGCVWNCYRYVSGAGTTEVLVYVTANDTAVSSPKSRAYTPSHRLVEKTNMDAIIWQEPKNGRMLRTVSCFLFFFPSQFSC